ncbi:hypothetical protein HNQ99_003183 [Rhizorhapis suberifaciens]|uniref:Uncharacterized protein n=1 Tax=Rhizorhapis suberifaciens TaxID=13656 RepID=A0A840HZ30_9SPHN|nr:hypothetical protein [Rhizorhapis suberifaciens]
MFDPLRSDYEPDVLWLFRIVPKPFIHWPEMRIGI